MNAWENGLAAYSDTLLTRFLETRRPSKVRLDGMERRPDTTHFNKQVTALSHLLSKPDYPDDLKRTANRFNGLRTTPVAYLIRDHNARIERVADFHHSIKDNIDALIRAQNTNAADAAGKRTS